MLGEAFDIGRRRISVAASTIVLLSVIVASAIALATLRPPF